uniref:hypothetical protein n=1 Tax=Streptomyces odontomachi TaxID=2944940 RepID=UPI00210BBDF6|nr:hypothetical protein [Streptomyces sp. ODS25]
MLHRGGDREEARGRFLRLWAEIGEHGDPLHRCTLAHFMAGTQDDPLDELTWDLRALSAAEELAGADPAVEEDPAGGRSAGRAGGRAAACALYPALHLSLAVDYARIGRTATAHSHLRRARHATDMLQDGARRSGIPLAGDRPDQRLGKDGAGGVGS